MTVSVFSVRPMTGEDAQAVAAWRYPGEFAFYNWDADPADLAELLDPAGWGKQYFSVDGTDELLVGMFEFKAEGDSVEIGLGLRPDRTGCGLGLSFLECGVAFAASTLADLVHLVCGRVQPASDQGLPSRRFRRRGAVFA